MTWQESDYTGKKMWSLTVIRQSGVVQHGRNKVKIWHCRCVCGNVLDVDQAALVKGQKPACKTCRRGPCVICGSPIENDDWGVKRTTCSAECQREQLKAKHKRRYYKLIERDPEHNKKVYRHRKNLDPDHNKKRYQRRMALLNAMPEKARREIIQKQNEYTTLWRSKYVKDLKANDPEAYQKYRAACNAYFRRWYKQNRLKA